MKWISIKEKMPELIIEGIETELIRILDEEQGKANGWYNQEYDVWENWEKTFNKVTHWRYLTKKEKEVA
jgi:hypothetical protein